MNQNLLSTKKIFQNIFFSNQLNAENLPMVKSVEIKPLFKKAKYQLKSCETKYYHFKIPGKMLSHNWSKKSYLRNYGYKTLLYYSM